MIPLVRPRESLVVSALKRYDPNLDIRFSWQKGKWAITTRPLRPDLIPPPIRWEKGEEGWGETMLPERSEARISYRTKTMPVAYVGRLSAEAISQVIEADTWKNGRIERQLEKMQEVVERDRMIVKRDRWREARDYMKWHARTHPMAA